MSAAESAKNVSCFQRYEQVVPEYQHRQKFVKPGDALITPKVYLKWYDIYREESPIPAQFIHEARSFLCSELEAERLPLNNELGFAVHHQCANVYIMYICTWRNENEVWETIYQKNLAGDSQWRLLERGSTAPTFCVWVLAAVWHEQQAWTRYLSTHRDSAAKYAYTQDQLTGLV